MDRMGDHRLAVEISIAGFDGKRRKIDWWVNWSDTSPAAIYRAVVELAEKSGLPIDHSEIWNDHDPLKDLRREE